LIAFVMFGAADVFGRKPDNGALVRLEVVLIVAEHHQARIDQERAEDVDDPVEALDELSPREDHYHSQDEGSHDAPKENAVLKLLWNLEETEDQQEDEQVIDRE